MLYKPGDIIVGDYIKITAPYDEWEFAKNMICRVIEIELGDKEYIAGVFVDIEQPLEWTDTTEYNLFCDDEFSLLNGIESIKARHKLFK